MRVSIMTCDRKPSYLLDTIEGLLVQEINCDIYYQSTHYSGFIDTLKPYGDDVQKNAQYNYAITLINSRNDIILEDDVQICKNFDIKVQDYTVGLPQKYALALYSCYNWNNSPNVIVEYPIIDFYGTQAMMYDKETRIGFGQYLLQHIGEQPYDLALKTYLQQTGTLLFATKHSLVQHMGVVTTGLGHHHQSPTFIDDIL